MRRLPVRCDQDPATVPHAALRLRSAVGVAYRLVAAAAPHSATGSGQKQRASAG